MDDITLLKQIFDQVGSCTEALTHKVIELEIRNQRIENENSALKYDLETIINRVLQLERVVYDDLA